jgi:hypothetical protein
MYRTTEISRYGPFTKTQQAPNEYFEAAGYYFNTYSIQKCAGEPTLDCYAVFECGLTEL